MNIRLILPCPPPYNIRLWPLVTLYPSDLATPVDPNATLFSPPHTWLYGWFQTCSWCHVLTVSHGHRTCLVLQRPWPLFPEPVHIGDGLEIHVTIYSCRVPACLFCEPISVLTSYPPWRYDREQGRSEPLRGIEW